MLSLISLGLGIIGGITIQNSISLGILRYRVKRLEYGN